MKQSKPEDLRHSKRTEMLLLILAVTWIIFITLFAQLMEWLMEQTLFESTSLFPDMRWLIHLAYTVLLSFPLLITSFITQNFKLKIIFNFWGIVSFSGFFLTQGRFTLINQANLVSLLQIGGAVIYLSVLIIFNRKQKIDHNKSFITERRELYYITGFIAILLVPWVIWGALGSLFDTALNIIAAISISFLFLYIYKEFFLKKIVEYPEISFPGNFLNGFILFIGLIISSTTFGQNGQQWLLVLTVPFSAWLITRIFNHKTRGNLIPTFILLASIFAFPLCFFDPDEMSLLIGSQNGEIFTWVNQAILLTILLLLLLTALNNRINEKLLKAKNMNFWKYFPGFWIIPIMCYLFLGQPGFYGESYLLVLNKFVPNENLSQLSYESKKSIVYSHLVNHAQESQADIKRILDFWRIDYQTYYLVNAIEVKSGPIIRYYLERNNQVSKTLESPNLRPLPKKSTSNTGSLKILETNLWNLESIGVFRLREDYDVTGKGIIIGQADSGVDGQHPQLKEQYLGFQSDDNYHWLDPWNSSAEPTDLNGHGTYTLGIILGKDIGIAPEANWIGCVNLARNFGNPGFYIECLQFLFAPYPQKGNPFTEGRPDLGANIINNSWGCPIIEGCDQELFQTAMRILRESGVFIIAANGNEGYYGCESTKSPLAIYDDVLSVGAIDKNGELAPFSSLGPVNINGEVFTKPDLIAPGVDIFSTMPNGSYSMMSGTSAAAPHVSGIVALMWSANPDLIGNIALTEEILFSTSDKYIGIMPTCLKDYAIPNNAVGYGVVNAFNAVEASINLK